MRFRDQWRFVQMNARKNRSRLIMTVLATAMGCSFLILLASIGFGLEHTVISDLTEGRTLNEIAVLGKRTEGRTPDRVLTDEDVAYFRTVPRVRAVTRFVRVNQGVQIRWQGEDRGGANLYMMDFAAERAAGLELVAGRFPRSKYEILVGYHFAERLLSGEAVQVDGASVDVSRVVGTQLDVRVTQNFGGPQPAERWFSLTIAGVIAPPVVETELDPRVLIGEEFLDEIEAFTRTPRGELLPEMMSPAERNAILEGLAGIPRFYDVVVVYAMRLNDVIPIVETLMEAGYVVDAVARRLTGINTTFRAVQTGLILVGTFAVLIASVGIYNTMTMAVTERAQDIGIMKAIGAHPSAIMRIFLLESSYIGLLGALIGVAASYVLSMVLNATLPAILHRAFNLPLDELTSIRFSLVPGVLVFVSVAISVGVAVLSGLRPARKATRIDVLQALRRDL